ncbi:MAG: tetratricopeptide repeat protein [Deltaproteobacteria bacterium]|nr:tetratricopeptide repeat protein [Deltaproteobacteria bacterium]
MNTHRLTRFAAGGGWRDNEPPRLKPGRYVAKGMNTRLVSMTFAALLLLWSALSFAGEFEEGVAALNRGDHKTALAMFTKGANKGDARAQHILGVMYASGRGVSQDYNQAVSWYRKAAEQGYADA